MKTCFLITLPNIYSQNQSIIMINSNYSSNKKLSSYRWNQSYKMGNNCMSILDSSHSNWFYSMGPYNDIWRTDIFLIKPLINSKSLFYYPFKNSLLSFCTNYNKHRLDKEVPVFVNILGFNIKKLEVNYQNWHFYGSE